MTLTEACERAGLIWCGPATVQLRRDGSADVSLDADVTKFVGHESYTLHRHHVLDANGRATCHKECREIESELP